MKLTKTSIKSSIKIKYFLFNFLLIAVYIGIYFYKLNNIPDKYIIYIIASGILLTILLNYIIVYFSSIKPVKKIIAETEFLGRGDLDHILNLNLFPSELKPLAKNLNKMAETFQRDSTTLKNRINELTTIYKLNSEIAITLNLNEVMDTAKRILKSIIDFSKILIYVKDTRTKNYHLASGINLNLSDPLELEKDNELVQLAFTLNDAVVLNQFPEMMKSESKNENWEILSPMVVNKEQVGIIKIEIDEGKTVDEDIVRLIKTLTTQIGIGIQNSMLYSDLEQKVADQTLELRKSYEIIFSQKEELQKIIHSIGDPLVVTDEEHRVEMVNEAFIKVFDLPNNKEYLGMPISEVLKVDAVRDFFFENTTMNEGLFSKEVIVQTHELPDIFSEEKYFNVSSALVIRESRKRRYVTILRDITEQKKLDKMKTDFVSTVSHELRTPLTSIKAFAKILLGNKGTSDAEKYEFLSIIDSEADRLTRLINDILDLSKLEAGKLDFDFKPLDIVEIIRLQVKNLFSIIKEAGIKISLKRQEVPNIIGDKDRITQVITNLLSNATKFTQAGGSINITIKNVTLNKLVQKQMQSDIIKERYPLIDETHNYVQISVEDTGIGISKDNLAKVFDKFKQIGDTLIDKPQGTGLGLPICKQIMEAHQGNIWAESDVNKGSTFYFSLPVYSKRNKKLNLNKNKGTIRKIFIIDKDEEYRKELVLQLKKYEPYEANTIPEAIKLLETNKKFDLIIIDPIGLNTFSLFEKINSNRISIPIILNSTDINEKLPFLKQRIVKTPPKNVLLLKKINNLFETEKPKVLLAILDEGFSYQLSIYLTQNNYDIYLAKSGSEALRKSFGVNPDIILISDKVSDIKIKDFLYEIRNHEITKDIINIIITEGEDDIHYAEGVEVIKKSQGIEFIVAKINSHFLKFKEEIDV